MNKTYSKKHSGASIIELIFILAILILVGIAIWSFQKNVFFLNDVLQTGLGAEKEARSMIVNFSSEVRSASMSENGAYPIESASATSFVFYSDNDSDGITEKIRYFVEGKAVKKGIIKVNGAPPVYNSENEVITTIVQNLDNGINPLFEYYDSEYDGESAPLGEPTQIERIRMVKINIIIDKSSVRAPAPMNITTQVSIRNLKDNL